MIANVTLGDIEWLTDSVDAELVRGNQVNISDSIITQIQTNCPIFQGVAGAAALQALSQADSVSLAMPAAYVVPAGGAGADQIAGVGYRQVCTDTFSVMVVLENAANVRGQSAMTQIDNIKWSLIKALCNWKPDPLRSPRGCMFANWQVLDGIMDGARVWVQFEFDYEYQITDVDVYQYPGSPLTNINGNIRVGANTTPFNVR